MPGIGCIRDGCFYVLRPDGSGRRLWPELKEYQLKLKTGTLRELSEIYRDLHFIAGHKELSFGEKHLLQQIESLLVEKISLVEQLGQEKTMEHLRSLCSAHKTIEHSFF